MDGLPCPRATALFSLLVAVWAALVVTMAGRAATATDVAIARACGTAVLIVYALTCAVVAAALAKTRSDLLRSLGDSPRQGRAKAPPALLSLLDRAVALSAGVAMFNHNCSPNADWSLDSSGCLVVHTTRSVRTGEELCLSYVDIKWPRERRRAFLRKHFFFECTCEVCVPPRADAAPAAAGRADEVARKRRRT